MKVIQGLGLSTNPGKRPEARLLTASKRTLIDYYIGANNNICAGIAGCTNL